MYVPHVQRAERSAHARAGVWRWHVDVVYIKSTLHAGAAICSLSICKLAAAKVPISHIASKAGGAKRHVDEPPIWPLITPPDLADGPLAC
jgi:hypothetical protein